jgi:hypothetical protein
MSERTRVVIGCSTTPDYAFLLPITCLLWREVVGYKLLVLLAGSRSKWINGVGDFVTSEMPFGTEVQWIGGAGDYSEATIAQNSRQHASVLSFIEDDEWLMPADADLWPLKRDFYHQHEGTVYKAVCYYSNGDHFSSKQDVLERADRGLGSQTIPTCHVAMRARDWRAIYGLTSGESVAVAAKRTLDAWLPGRVEVPGRDMGMHVWMSDQQIMTEALCQQFWFPDKALMVERRGHPPLDRLDRSHRNDWNTFDASRWTDAHVHRTPWGDWEWSTLLPIVDALLPDHSKWVREYRAKFVEAMK